VRYFISQGIYYQYNVKRKLPWLRISEIAFTLILLLMFTGLAYQLIATKIDENQNKMKGKMVDVGGYRLFTNATGEGKVTVVFESDLGNPVQQWSKVREPLVRSARIFTYDRAGFGWSDKGNSPTDLSKEVRELRSLLKKSAVKAPYILVGHGYGGMVMTKFAEQYPNEVAGMVLINSWTEEFVKSSEFKEKISKELKKAQFKMYSSYLGITRMGHTFGLFKEDIFLSKGLTDEYIALYKAHQSTTKYNKALLEEIKALKNYTDNDNIEGIMGDKPVYVISSLENSLKTDKAAEWLEYQKGLLKLSSKSELVNMKDSSTFIHIDKPEEIINIISTVIKKVAK
jgi:pimeloyl-ACP methyl ester carboxylesterase